MRLVIIILIGLIAFMGIGIYSEIWLLNTAQEIAEELNQLEEMVKNEKWSEALHKVSQIQEKWFSVKDRWDIVVDNNEMDEVDLAIVRSIKYIEIESLDLALGEIAVLNHLVKCIAQKEVVNILNVF